MLIDVALIFGGYLVGSVSTAIVVCRILGLPDPRSGGSGNPGATNVLRLGGKGPAAVTLLGDVLKGALPVLLARAFGAAEGVLIGVAMAAFLGHLFPLFFRFHGGKGVATAIGAVSALSWPVGAAMGLTWLAVAALFRYSSLSSMIAALLAPLYAALTEGAAVQVAGIALMSAMLLYRHKANIERLAAGRESRIGERKSEPAGEL